jgi:hypothetical protein
MKKTNKQIFLVYACNEWKENSSMELILATTSVRKLKSCLANEIKQDNINWEDSEWSKTKQISEFKRCFDFEDRKSINDKLIYGYFDYCYDGERI